jgi:hypothetical protein
MLQPKSIQYSREEKQKEDTFQPIIDFPNFLLIVLKITKRQYHHENSVTLDDKQLIVEFDQKEFDREFVKNFAFNLLKARYLLDNYIVHHSNEEETVQSNPWKLQKWTKKR